MTFALGAEPGQPRGWHHQLTRVSAAGHYVDVASANDQAEVELLLVEMLKFSVFGDQPASASELSRWAHAALSSCLWLVLILRDARGAAQGLAICEYIAYEVDITSRILKCKQFYVRPSAGDSLLPPATLLLDAILEAAVRSPQLRDVFIVSTGAKEHGRLPRVLQRRGFRRIGTQHIGRGCNPGFCASNHDELQEVESLSSLRPHDVQQLKTLAQAFHVESQRASLGIPVLAFERLLACAEGGPAPGLVAYLARMRGEIVGFIAGREGAPALSAHRYLYSSFFYVAPPFRPTALALKLFDAFASKAQQLGLAGVCLGTSSDITVDRVCRLLELRGFPHGGDVLTARVVRKDAA